MLACYISSYLKYKMLADEEAIKKLREFILFVSQDARETRGKKELDCATFFMREWDILRKKKRSLLFLKV